MDITIRRCIGSDASAVHKIVCQLEGKNLDKKAFIDIFNKRLENPDCFLSVAKDDLNILGFIHMKIDEQLHHANKVATIDELVVLSGFRGQGIGQKLLQRAVAQAKDAGCECVELTSALERTDAHQFYERNRFDRWSIKFGMEL